MPSPSDTVRTVIEEWAMSPGFISLGISAYGFGSVFHEAEIRFNPGRSDVDLLGILPTSISCSNQRLGVLRKLKEQLGILRLQLENNVDLNPNKLTVSFDLFSSFEYDWSIVANNDPKFFTANEFIPIGSALALTKPRQNVRELPADCEDAINSIRKGKEFRKRLLNLEAAGDAWDNPSECLPKDLVRNAQRLNSLIKSLPLSDRYYKEQGTVFVFALLTREQRKAHELSELYNLIAPRFNSGAPRKPIDAWSHLLLWEILCDEAQSALQAYFEQSVLPRPEEGSAKKDKIIKKVYEAAKLMVTGRGELAVLALHDFHSGSGHADFPLVTGQDWLLTNPVPVDDVKLDWNSSSQPVEPCGQVFLGGLRWHELRQTIYPDTTFVDELCYRLLKVEPGFGRHILTFGAARYSDYVDTCEFSALEYAHSVASGVSQNRTHSEYRRSIPYALEFQNRNAVAGINTILILRGTPSGDVFFLHKRGLNTVEGANTYHVVPAGTFQPDSYENGFFKRDFSIKRTVLREFSEELLGLAELEQTNRAGEDFVSDPRLNWIIFGLYSGAVKIYYFGLGLDPLTLKPEILTCLVINATMFPDFAVSIRNNFEGRSFQVELTDEQLQKWSAKPEMLPAGAACLELTLKHKGVLLG